jgi:hypothetical protein
VEYKKAPDRPREVRYAARSGAGATSRGGNQARMNKQYSGQIQAILAGAPPSEP